MTINATKTERTIVSRHTDRIEEEWRMTRKLGSFLCEAEDVARRKKLANFVFRKLWTVWLRRSQSCLQLWVRLYASFVVPVLTYNTGAWGLTKSELERLDAHHRHLRQIVAIHWSHRISNETLYNRCRCRPISEAILTSRWSLFGHVLRMPPNAPAQRVFDNYFVELGVTSFRGRPRTTLPTVLSADLRRIGRKLRCPADVDALRALDRGEWRELGRELTN